MSERPKRMRVISWNVNGLRACASKGFVSWLSSARAHVIGVQEVRAEATQLPPEVRAPARWHTHFVAAERRGYSGVGLYSRWAPDAVDSCVEAPHFDREGRVQIAHFGRLSIANIYFPKGSGPLRDNSRVPYKLAFYAHVLERLQSLRARGQRVLVMGDFNTAHQAIDLARPRENVKNSGFLPEERAALDSWVQAGFIDTFRRFKSEGGHYTWWRQWGESRQNNVGWRIDYVFACPAAMPYVSRAFIWPEVALSDHCPVGIELSTEGMDQA